MRYAIVEYASLIAYDAIHEHVQLAAAEADDRRRATLAATAVLFQRGAGARCVAAPIRDPQGEIVASVGVSSPVTRLHAKRIVRAATEVVAVAHAISASLAS